MKKPSVDSFNNKYESEADMNEDTLLPLIDNMLKQRKLIAKQLNEKFKDILDGEIDVDISSSWKKIRKEIEIREEQQESEVTQTEENVSEEKQDDEQVQNED